MTFGNILDAIKEKKVSKIVVTNNLTRVILKTYEKLDLEFCDYDYSSYDALINVVRDVDAQTVIDDLLGYYKDESVKKNGPDEYHIFEFTLDNNESYVMLNRQMHKGILNEIVPNSLEENDEDELLTENVIAKLYKIIEQASKIVETLTK